MWLNGHFAQINLCNLVVVEQRFRFAMMNNAAAVHHPRAVGDFQRETGLGDGKTINVIDAIGVTMAATKELSKDVRSLRKQIQTRGVAA